MADSDTPQTAAPSSPPDVSMLSSDTPPIDLARLQVPDAEPGVDWLFAPLRTVVIRVDPRRLVLLEVNARYMAAELLRRMSVVDTTFTVH